MPTPSDAELRHWLEVALACCDAADEIALASFRSALDVTRKADQSLVTAADRAIEQLIRDQIARRFPDHGLVGEEHGSERLGAAARWYIDPIDATHNFVRGIPIFATLVAVEVAGELQLGVVSAPALGSRWFAWRGGGAWKGRSPAGAQRIRVSTVDRLEEAQLLYRSLRNMRATSAAAGFERLVGRVQRDRGFGDFWGYMLVAEGAAEAMIESDVDPWDLAAPHLIVQEAGGRCTDFEGQLAIDTGDSLASNGRLHEALLAELRPA